MVRPLGAVKVFARASGVGDGSATSQATGRAYAGILRTADGAVGADASARRRRRYTWQWRRAGAIADEPAHLGLLARVVERAVGVWQVNRVAPTYVVL